MMYRHHHVVIRALGLSVIGIVNIHYLRSSVKDLSSDVSSLRETIALDTERSLIRTADTYKEQRDELSRITNNVKQQLGVMSCEMRELKEKLNMVRMLHFIQTLAV